MAPPPDSPRSLARALSSLSKQAALLALGDLQAGGPGGADGAKGGVQELQAMVVVLTFFLREAARMLGEVPAAAGGGGRGVLALRGSGRGAVCGGGFGPGVCAEAVLHEVAHVGAEGEAVRCRITAELGDGGGGAWEGAEPAVVSFRSPGAGM
jgi:hypothetical protein